MGRRWEDGDTAPLWLQFPGEGGDVGVAQPQGGRRWDRGQRRRGKVTAEGRGARVPARVSATLGSAQGRGQGQERGEGGATSKGASHSLRPGELWMRLGGGARAGVGGGAWVSFPDEVRGPGCEHRKGGLGRSIGWLEVRQARQQDQGVRWSVDVGHGH